MVAAREEIDRLLAPMPILPDWQEPDPGRSEAELIALLAGGMDDARAHLMATLPMDTAHVWPRSEYGVFCNAYITSRGVFLWAFATEEGRAAFLARHPDASSA